MGVVVGQGGFLCIPCRRHVDLIGCEPFSMDDVGRHVNKHQCKRCDMSSLFKAKHKGKMGGNVVKSKTKQVWAWQLSNVCRYLTAVPYNHPRGAVIWVRLSDEVNLENTSLGG